MKYPNFFMEIEKKRCTFVREMDKDPIYNKVKHGLSSAEVERSRAEYGENILTPPARTSLWKLYLEKYKDPIIQILLVAAAFSLVIAAIEDNYIETLGIIIAIFLATTIGFLFERDAAKKFSSLTAMDDDTMVKAIRDGAVCLVPRREVVVGDADEDEVAVQDLHEELLTEKEVTPSRPPQGEEAYPKDMVLRSTMVMNGSGIFVVTAVGDNTEIGKVAITSTETTQVKTPLNIQLDRLAKIISKVGTGISVAAFVIFLVHDILTDDAVWHSDNYLLMAEVVLKYFMMAVTLIVMAVPEGLPMAVTLALALNMRRMLKSNNLVRKLHACETMGAVTVICTDKTGTLTENKMTVAASSILPQKGEAHQEFFKAIALNTTATHDVGNPTEQALLKWLMQQGVDYRTIRDSHTITHRQPFTTELKYMSTTADGITYIKGAPEVILEMRGERNDEELQIDEIKETLRGWQEKGMRTLAFAIDRGEGVELQAICAISDPLRQEVPDAVRQCVNAGIDVKIVTGDTSATALEIARQIGILRERREERGERRGARYEGCSILQVVSCSSRSALQPCR